jgi:hypothetical protein
MSKYYCSIYYGAGGTHVSYGTTGTNFNELLKAK